MTAKTLMIMGTSSSAGKSLITAAICRCFSRRGVRVVPFKAQNMSNNSAVCADGSEIGRSQALQAFASSVPPHSDMNPILLKPEGDTHSQIILNGRPLKASDEKSQVGKSIQAHEYFKRKREFWPHVTSALDRLREKYELVVIEGAGSPAELNLSSVEIVNMAVARYAQAPVILVGDIERGGVFAQLLGTLWLLPPEERALVKGLIVNKFRGDLRLFDSGVKILEERGDLPVLGVLPWIDLLDLPEEDAVALSDANTESTPNVESTNSTTPSLDIAVIHFPHISNFDDFDPIARETSVRLRYVKTAQQIGRPDVVILPGTKNTLGDLNWLRMTGLADGILELHSQGKTIIGICGGYQMLGRSLENPHHVENDWKSASGLGLLEVDTIFQNEKQTSQIDAEITDDFIAPGMRGEFVSGYEIHVGLTRSSSPWLRLADSAVSLHSSRQKGPRFDGARSEDGRVWGCYLHGLFHNDRFRTVWLRSLGVANPDPRSTNTNESIVRSLDRLADAFESHVDMSQLEKIIWNQELVATHVG